MFDNKFQLCYAMPLRRGEAMQKKILIFLAVLCVAFASKGWAVSNEECLECHGSEDILQMSPQERLEMVVPTPRRKAVRKGGISLYVNPQKFAASVHGDFQCTDCHTEIGEIPHPQHMRMVDCSQCHEDIVDQYKHSKHAKVSKRRCYECHNPHYAQPFSKLTLKQRQAICLKCHKKVKHDWLPQEAYHFQHLECTTCHAPKAEKMMILQVYLEEKAKKQALTSKDLKRVFGAETKDIIAAIDKNHDNLIGYAELEDFLNQIKRKKIGNPFLNEQVVVSTSSHDFTDEVQHIKDCTMCHAAKKPFYKDTVLELPKDHQTISVKVAKRVVLLMSPIPQQIDYWNSVHGINDIQCMDCHADLKVVKTASGFEVVSGARVCENCHGDIMEEYEGSQHYKASKKSCSGCHDPHSVGPFAQLTVAQRSAICLKCHKDTKEKHQWLPQQDIHFEYVECTMCHAPGAEKGIVFYLEAIDNQGKERKVSYENIVKLLNLKEGTELQSVIDKNGDNILQTDEVSDFLQKLNANKEYLHQKGWEKIRLGVNLVVLQASHNYTSKGLKAKECYICHAPDTKFYSKLLLELPTGPSEVAGVDLDKYILVSLEKIPRDSGFYFLGQNRISKQDLENLKQALKKKNYSVILKIGYKWLDVIGVLMIIGIIGFVGFHTTLRILTIPNRRRRRKEH